MILGLVGSQEQAFAFFQELSPCVKLLKAARSDPANPRPCETGAMDGAFQVNQELDTLSDCERPMAPETKPSVAEIYQRADLTDGTSAVLTPHYRQPAIASGHL